uniref:Uncharacterized protein n=1 Tax=Rangifer tarandus platyrhynchus TaxID=3082113 RepID=A0ACB0FN52_RANTA|nr:unnamed protein product [Rangifer tarandus platyrhynchus]
MSPGRGTGCAKRRGRGPARNLPAASRGSPAASHGLCSSLSHALCSNLNHCVLPHRKLVQGGARGPTQRPDSPDGVRRRQSSGGPLGTAPEPRSQGFPPGRQSQPAMSCFCVARVGLGEWGPQAGDPTGEETPVGAAGVRLRRWAPGPTEEGTAAPSGQRHVPRAAPW